MFDPGKLTPWKSDPQLEGVKNPGSVPEADKQTPLPLHFGTPNFFAFLDVSEHLECFRKKKFFGTYEKNLEIFPE